MSDLHIQFDNVFFEKTRLSIITILSRNEVVSFNQLKALLQISDGSLYSHLEKLREANYVERRKEIINENAATLYWLTEGGRKAFTDYLTMIESIIKTHKKES